MQFFKEKWVLIFILVIIALGVWLRFFLYGDPNLSIGNDDTSSYVAASGAPVFSKEIFTGRRLFTTNILYKIANNPDECPLQMISSPAAGTEGYRAIQPCFNKIVLLQSGLSTLGWCLLAWATTLWLENPLHKTAAVVLILVFGFTPQIAEWDSILSTESLSISLFAITLALLMEIVRVQTDEAHPSFSSRSQWLIILWFVIFVLWVFIRDVHVYALLVTAALMLPLMLVAKFRKSATVVVVIILSIFLFLLGSITARNSARWQPSIMHVFAEFVDPYPARVEFFHRLGMPQDRSGKGYEEWFQEKAMGAYGRFLISHPGFVVATLFEASFFKADFIQPYFRAAEVKYRDALLIIGEFVHPETYAIYLIDVLLLVSACYTAVRSRDPRLCGWAWLAIWLFSYLAISLWLSYFGDTSGTRRHVFPSVEGFRLFAWIFLLKQIDIAGEKA